MRILIVGSLPSRGLLYHPARTAMEMAGLGHEVHVFTHGKAEQTPGLAGALKGDGVRLHQSECLRKWGWQALVSSSLDLREKIRRIAPDVVHTYGPVAAFQSRPSRSSGDRWRAVVMVSAMGSTARSPWPARIGCFLLNRYADLSLALCDAERRRLEVAGIDKRRLRLIYNPLDCADLIEKARSRAEARAAFIRRYELPPGCRLLGCFANLNPGKRHLMLIHALAETATSGDSWFVVMAGEGPEEQRCRALVRTLGLERRILFPGRLPTADSIPLLASMDAVVHASAAETFGYSMIEPLLFGIPTLVTRVGIGFEIEKAGKALVVTPDDRRQLAGGLIRLLRLDSDVLELVRGAPEWVRKTFDVPIIAKQLLGVYST